MKNRSEIEIMAAILNAAVSNWEYKTTIMINAGVSHSQLTRYLMTAVDRKLMEYSGDHRFIQDRRGRTCIHKETRGDV